LGSKSLHVDADPKRRKARALQDLAKVFGSGLYARSVVGGSEFLVRSGSWGHSPSHIRGHLSAAEEVELGGGAEFLEAFAFAAVAVGGRFAFGGEFGVFEVGEDFLGAFDDRFGDAGEARDLDAVAFVGSALDDFAQENNLVVPFADGDVVVAHARKAAGEFGEFVIMRGEKGFGFWRRPGCGGVRRWTTQG
jgi:hypothetical protein